MNDHITIRKDAAMPTPVYGRKVGDGENIRLLGNMKPDESLWNLSHSRAQSLRTTARRKGIRVQVIRIPGTDLYALKRLS